MSLDLLEVILVVIAVFSQIAMINLAIAKDTDKLTNSWIVYNPLRTADYITITRREKGRIAGWFWTFLVSIACLAIVVVVELVTGK